MEFTPYAPAVPGSRQIQRLALRQSPTLLALWALCAGAAFVTSLLGADPIWSMFAMMGSMLFLLALWFSLQWDLVRHYVPDLPLDKWTFRSVTGFVLGVFAGGVVGTVGAASALRLAPDVVSYETTGVLALIAAGAGLVIGFATLGWCQAYVLNAYVSGAWWWVGAMALAWVPVPLTWLAYEAILGTMVINIYPGPHTIVKILASEVALLSPALGLFALIVWCARPASTEDDLNVQGRDRRSARPLDLFVGLLLPPLAVIAAFGVLLIGQGLRVERVWVAAGPADYLGLRADGQVVTIPSPDEKWDPTSKLRDFSVDRAMQAGVDDSRIVLTSTVGGASRYLQVFGRSKPADYYANNVVNIVRFSPDGKFLAAGTGQAIEGDSYVNPSDDHAVHVWFAPDGSSVYTFTDPLYSVRALAWSPDGRYLAAAGGLENKYWLDNGDNVVRVWRLDGQRGGEGAPSLAFTLVGHTTTVEALAWFHDGTRLVSRDVGGLVVIWRIP